MHPASPPRAPAPRALQIGVLVLIVVALLAVTGAFALYRAATRPKPLAETPPPAGTFRPTPAQYANLTFAAVAPHDFTTGFDAEGKIALDDAVTTPVFSPFSGQVTRVFVQAGDRVRKGQPLFAVGAAELVQGESDLSAALQQLRLAEAAAARQTALLKVQGTATKDYEQSLADLANARTAVSAARDRLAILGVPAAEIARVQARGGGRLPADAVVRAPIAGVVISRALGPGQVVTSLTTGGATPVLSVSDLSRVWLVANVREEDAGALRLGDRLSARLEALPGRILEARVDYVAPSLDPQTRRVSARATVPNPRGELRPEMFADVTVSTGPPAVAPAVPAEAVVYEGPEARVWVAREGRTLELRRVRVGRTQGDWVEILSGLRPGERVVRQGAIFIDRATSLE